MLAEWWRRMHMRVAQIGRGPAYDIRRHATQGAPPAAYLEAGGLLLFALVVQFVGSGLLWSHSVLVAKKPLMPGVILQRDDVDVQRWTGPSNQVPLWVPAERLPDLVGQPLQQDIFPGFPIARTAFETERLAPSAGHEGVQVPLSDDDPWTAEAVRPGVYVHILTLGPDANGGVAVRTAPSAARVLAATYQEVPGTEEASNGVRYDRVARTTSVMVEAEPSVALALAAAEGKGDAVDLSIMSTGRPKRLVAVSCRQPVLLSSICGESFKLLSNHVWWTRPVAHGRPTGRKVTSERWRSSRNPTSWNS